MSHVGLVRFVSDRCVIPPELTPTTYHVDTQRWLYFIDRSQNHPGRNLRDLVLLPCGSGELQRLYSVTLGLSNAPGATAVGTNLMQEFELSLKYEQAYDGRAGDIGSKVCAVVFPSGKTPKEFDDFVANWVTQGNPGSALIRQANHNPRAEVKGSYSSELDAYFGSYICARRYLPRSVDIHEIGQVTIHGEPATIQKTTPLTLQLNDQERLRVEQFLSKAYGQGQRLEGQCAHVSFDPDYEALSFSFLDPDDILCWIGFTFRGTTPEAHKVVSWFGSRGVDFRQYQIVHDANGYELKLLCDLSLTDLHRFDKPTLEQHLIAELNAQLRAPATPVASPVGEVTVVYEHETLKLYDSFTERDRFHLAGVFVLDSKGQVVLKWPTEAEVWPEVVRLAATVKETQVEIVVDREDRTLRQAIACRHADEKYVIAAQYHNTRPTNFAQNFKNLSRQKLSTGGGDISFREIIHRNLLHGLKYDYLSRDAFNNLGQLDGEQFRRESDDRFSKLKWKYIEEKWFRDKFAFHGNVKLAEMLGEYLADHPPVIRRLATTQGERVRLLDVGPGVGALTTALIVRRNPELWDNLDRVDLVLLDAAQQVLDETIKAADEYPRFDTQLREELQLDREEELNRFVQFLQRATRLKADISGPSTDLHLLDGTWLGRFDIVYSGFCHHHMNRAMKVGACRAMLDLAKSNGFVGVVDESLTYKQYLLYRVGHSTDPVPVATESYFQSAAEHAELFDDRYRLHHKTERGNNKYYAFWGVKTDRAPLPQHHYNQHYRYRLRHCHLSKKT